ncbi:MAG: sigma factor [Planctomycetota bacterium]
MTAGFPSHGPFPPTSLGLVRRLASPGPEAWEEFYRRYSRPLLVFALLERRLSQVDAEDLVQSFLAYLMEAPRVEGFDPAKGRFRSWLLVVFKRFHKDRKVAERAAKRGGGWVKVGNLEERVAEYRAGGVDPQRAFEREWALASVRDAVSACERALAAAGELDAARWLEARYRGPLESGAERPSRSEAGRALKLTEGRAKASEARVKGLLRACLEAQVRADLGEVAGEDLKAGLKELLDALG